MPSVGKNEVPEQFKALFEGVGEPSLSDLTGARVVALVSGDIVFSNGNDVPVVPLLMSGRVRVFSPSDSGHEITLYEIQPGETCVLAASSALSGNVYPATAMAETDTEAWLVPQDSFIRLFTANELFRAFVFDAFSSRLSVLMSLVEEVAFRKMDQRLATYLLRRVTEPGDRLRETQEAIAAQLGTVREVVSRILGDFERKGLVRTGRGYVQVLDIDDLKAISGKRG